jgi:ribosomal protein S20
MGIFDFLTGGPTPVGGMGAEVAGPTGGIGDMLTKAFGANANTLSMLGLGLATARTAEQQRQAIMNGYVYGSQMDSNDRKEKREEEEKKRKEAKTAAFQSAMAGLYPQYRDAIMSGDTESATALIRMAQDKAYKDQSAGFERERIELARKADERAGNRPIPADSTLLDPTTLKPVYTPPTKPQPPIKVGEGDRLIDPVTRTEIPIPGQDPNQPTGATIDREGKLRSEFEKDVGVFPKLDRHYRTVQALASKPGATGYDDIGLVFNFMKMFDPDSAVLPGEYATAAQAGNVPENVWAFYNKIVSGEKLTEEQRAKMASAAKTTYETAADQYDKRRAHFGEIAKSYKLDPDRILPKWSRPSETTAASTPPDANPILQEAVRGEPCTAEETHRDGRH